METELRSEMVGLKAGQELLQVGMNQLRSDLMDAIQRAASANKSRMLAQLISMMTLLDALIVYMKP